MFTTYSKTVNLNEFLFDPHYELSLTDEQREEMESEWQSRVIAVFDETLAPYDAEILGNGEITISIDRVAKFSEVADDILMEVSQSDFDENHEFFDKWATIAEKN